MKNNIDHLSQESASVYKYLKLMENRKLDEAKKMLSNDFTMIFPGSMSFRNLDELVDYGKKRQISVFKTFESFEEINNSSSKIIYVRGKLFGITVKGKEFNNIRYIDKFIVSGEKFLRQQVWNDFAKKKLINSRYSMPKEKLPKIKRENIELPLKSEVLDFVFSLDFKQNKLQDLFLKDKFLAILPGSKLLNSKHLIDFLEREKTLSEKNIFDINLIENNQSHIIYLDGSISGLNIERKKYRNIRFIERIEFDILSNKILSFEVWDDLSEHGF
ncbi:MAG: hypothetical protein CMM18_04525 [Rhodospirillaceae bacterium]|nr:hypothetical protein [Rhodospirillaceae bacterium]